MDPAVIYRGIRIGGACTIITGTDGEPLGAVPHIVTHSPARIAWGYEGSRPLDCARSLLIAALGADAACPACSGTGRMVWPGGEPGPRAYDPAADAEADTTGCDCGDGYRPLPYEDFMRHVVAGWADGWEMTRADILEWLATRTPQAGGPADAR